MCDQIELGICKYNNNTGVTCYMNSILAILQQTPYFADYIISNNYYIEDNTKNKNIILNSVIYQLFKIFKISMSNDNKQLTINTFRDNIAKKNFIWGEHQQQDSQEFLTFLLNTIEDEIKDEVLYLPGRKIEKTKINIENLIALKSWEEFSKKEYSIIKELFTGQNQSILECEKCKNKSSRFEIFTNLQLDINDKCSDIYDCLNSYIKKEQLEKENKVWCQFCFQKNRAFKSNYIWRTPKILIINLKRFKYNDYGMVTSKNNKFIRYPIEDLDISNYINPNSPYFDKCKYDLFGVNIHKSIGGLNNINFGHYISCVKNRFDNKWYTFDDNCVTKANIDNIINPNCYLLFYLRKN
jgi:ubiquitin C-terminal hydrolase